MMKFLSHCSMLKVALLGSTILAAPGLANAQLNNAVAGNNGTLPTPPGLFVTPIAPLTSAIQQPLNPGLANYPNYVAGEAVKVVVSPDGTTLAILTAGMNSLYHAWSMGAPTTAQIDYAASTQFIFIYDISGSNKTNPQLKQVLPQNNSHVGLAWNGNNTLYAAGGNDDNVYVYTKNGGSFVAGTPIALGHVTAASTASFTTTRQNGGLGLLPVGSTNNGVQPNASGLAVTADGNTLVVANNYNDSISIISTATNSVVAELDLRPYASGAPDGTKGGTFPYSVAISGTTAYVGSDRDREVVAVNIATPAAPVVTTRITVPGNPNGMTVHGSTLYVAQDNQDVVSVINTATNTVTANIDTRGPASLGLPAATTGAAPTAVTVSPDGNTLYAVNAGSNSIAVIPLTGSNAFTTTGLIPTAYDPTDIAFSADGSWMYIVNGKSDQGANAAYGYGNTGCIQYITYPVPPGVSASKPSGFTNTGCGTGLQSTQATYQNSVASAQLTDNNQYQFQLEHATLVSAKVPAAGDLTGLTAAVAANNAYSVTPPASDAQVMNFLKGKIQHVIYIVKENRTFDQILGDLNNGSDGEPALALFGKRVTPSFHRMATNFVTLDNFMDPGDGSMDGWSWSMRGRVTNTETLSQQINYARVNRGLSYEGEGQNRNIPSNLPSVAARDFFFAPGNTNNTPATFTQQAASAKGGPANMLAGDGDHAATDGPLGYQNGYIFNAVYAAGYTVRNYGWQANTPGATTKVVNGATVPVTDPFADGIVQTTAANNFIASNGFYDPYFRAYDQAYVDLWRANEFIRDVKANGLKSLSMIRGLSHDHTGSFTATVSTLSGINTPELEQADNDYACGKLVEWISHSQYANNTLIIIIEDDSQDGADHVDSHRSTTYFVGPYVKKNAVVSTRYSQPNVLRTIEDIFGTQHLNLNTYYARPMADVFDITQNGTWSFTAVASPLLANTPAVYFGGFTQADNGINKVQFAEGPAMKPTHDAAYWAEKTRGFDFSGEDRVPADLYNEILWEGINGTPAPVTHTRFMSVLDVPSK